MRFLDPAFLWGLLALGVPVVLHLLLRRRLPIVEFPLTRLVARAEHVQQPRRRLNRVLLLLSRAAMLALLALALARLTLGGAEVQASGPVGAVVLLDDSLSMRARSASGESVFAQGRAMADSFLAALPEGSEAVVLPLSRASTAGDLALGAPATARRDLAQVEPSWLALKTQPALEAAARLLAGCPLEDRRIVLVSDLARHGLEGVSLARGDGARRPRLVVLSPLRAEEPNLSVSGLDAEVMPGGHLRATARLSAWGEEGRRVRADVDVSSGPVDGTSRLVGRGRVETVVGAVGERRFEIASPPEGLGATEARLPNDVLDADDVRHAVQVVRRNPRMLVIDGDPQNLSFGSETFYLEKALAPGVGLDLDARFTTLSEWVPRDLEGCAAVILANVPDLTQERAAALERLVRGGAGLVIALGNRVDQRAWNGSLAELMPATLGLISVPPEPATVAPGGAIDLPRVHVRTWYRLEPDPGAEVLSRLSDGAPWVVEGRLGAGRVIVVATSLDRDWTDLPISPWYLAFVRELVLRASPRGDVVALPSVVVGSALDLAPVALATAPVVKGPSGERPVEEGLVTPIEPGVHVVREGGVARAAFAAVVDPAESDLSRVAAADLARQLEGALDVGGVVESASSGWAGGIAAWKGLLVALLALFAAESWLARRAS